MARSIKVGDAHVQWNSDDVITLAIHSQRSLGIEYGNVIEIHSITLLHI